MTSKKLLLFLLISLTALANSLFSETVIDDGSEISGTWNLAGSPYIIMGEATILVNAELVIEAGVEVKFATGTSFDYSEDDFDAGFLRINGKITAIGTEESQISFTRNTEDGNWSIIFFSETADASSILDNCSFEFGNSISNLLGTTGFWGTISFNNSGSKIENSSIDQAAYSSIYCSNNSSPVIENNTIKNSVVAGILTDFSYPSVNENLIQYNNYGIYCTNNSIFEIKHNQIIDNINDGINCDSSSPIIINNKISNNSFGISLYESSPDIIGNLISENINDGINCYTNSSPDITNNTIVNNQEHGVFVYNIASPVITNTIFHGNNETNDLVISVYDNETSYPIVKYSSLEMLEGELQANVQIQPGNIYNQNPTFSNQGGNPFSITEESPCTDTGTPNAIGLNLPDEDIIYNPRITNDNIDMGAYEYGAVNCNYELQITNYELRQNYPNPFNPITKISYGLAADSEQLAEIVVYNAMGQEVWSSNPSPLNPNSCLFDGSSFNSGIYFYSLVVNGIVKNTKSMILIK